jgi:protein-S-isoprenylcysteine O-methyltransferase Ste14
MRKCLQRASREYTGRRRLVALVPLAVLLLLVLPLLIVRVAGASLGVAGLALGLWSIGSQVTVGSGTPLPMMPTRRLVVEPPFTLCRNPMTLGTVLAGLGIGVWIGSFSAIGIVMALGAALLAYVRLVEEKELEARFGQDYLDHKRSTPFLPPRPRSHGHLEVRVRPTGAGTRP